MEKKNNRLLLVTAIIGGISFSWFIYDLFAFSILRPKLIAFESLSDQEMILGGLVWVGFLVFILFHLMSLITLIGQMRQSQKSRGVYGLTFAITVLSLIFIMGDIGLLNDIGKESKFKLDVSGEWTVLYIVFCFHGLFHLLMSLSLAKGFAASQKSVAAEGALKDDTVFQIAQYVGIICGLVGLANLTLDFVFHVPLWCVKPTVWPTAVFVFMPYVLVVAYWFMIKRREKPAEWYDERQFKDICRSGFFTLLFSLPLMGILYAAHFGNPDGLMSMLWFPYQLYFTLLFFSGLNLFFTLKES